MFIKLYCPKCGNTDKITVTVSSRYGNKDHYPVILNCPNCGKWEIDFLQGLKNDTTE